LLDLAPYVTIPAAAGSSRCVALLPDGEPAAAEAWLLEQPQVTVIARDCSGGYALAVAEPLPDATHVMERGHLMEDASRAFLNAVRKSMRQVRAATGAAAINPHLLTAAERIEYEGYRATLLHETRRLD
jgi:transposase